MQVRACARLWRLTLLLRRTFLEIHKIKSRSVKCVYLPTRGIEQSIPPRPESKDDLQGKIRCHRRGAFFSSPNYYYSAIKKTAVNKNPRWLKIGDKIPVMCFVLCGSNICYVASYNKGSLGKAKRAGGVRTRTKKYLRSR